MAVDRKRKTGHRRNIVHIRLTDAQLEMVEASAAEAGLSVSEWIRQTLSFNLFNSPSRSGRAAYRRRIDAA